MKFRTELEVGVAPFKIDYSQSVFCIGSCFSERMAEQLSDRKFDVLSNPFGILFQPLAISNCIKSVIAKSYLSEADLIFKDGIYHSLQHHSDFSNPNAAEAISNINSGIDSAHDFLKHTDVAIITLGTAIVFEHEASKQIVGNCHRIPQKEFSKRMLCVSEVVENFNDTISLLLNFNPSIKIILSVSPVRYLSFGFHENQLAKATLLLAIDELIKRHANLFYFPAYEIVMDDLRDYRFMNEDLIHPNQQAVTYIWEKFCNTFFTNQTKKMIEDVEQIMSAVNHRVRFENSAEHIKFKANFLSKTLVLAEKLAQVNWKKELDYFQQ